MVDQHADLGAFIERHRLPPLFRASATDYFIPLADWVAHQRAAYDRPGFVLGINGAQGTGKSTLASFFVQYLKWRYQLNVVVLSIDDLYLTRAERRSLAQSVHPLLLTRGVPGTHDVPMGCRLIEQLRSLGTDDTLAIPRFDKSTDDRVRRQDWPRVQGPIDVVIVEGWCVSARPQSSPDLIEPINDLEAREDREGTWRRYVNAQLGETYPALFEMIDALVYLQVPGFDAVLRWRTEQERKLRALAAPSAQGVLSDRDVARFIQHFERVTKSNMEQMPERADAVIGLGEDHAANSLRINR